MQTAPTTYFQPGRRAVLGTEICPVKRLACDKAAFVQPVSLARRPVFITRCCGVAFDLHKLAYSHLSGQSLYSRISPTTCLTVSSFFEPAEPRPIQYADMHNLTPRKPTLRIHYKVNNHVGLGRPAQTRDTLSTRAPPNGGTEMMNQIEDAIYFCGGHKFSHRQAIWTKPRPSGRPLVVSFAQISGKRHKM